MATLFILFFAVLTLLAGMIILLDPEIIFAYLRKNIHRLSLHITAVTVRLVIGVLLISQSEVSRFPFVIEVLGWLSIAAALTFALMGRRNFNRLMAWALSILKPYGRVGGVFAAAFGGFLLYAFI